MSLKLDVITLCSYLEPILCQVIVSSSWNRYTGITCLDDTVGIRTGGEVLHWFLDEFYRTLSCKKQIWQEVGNVT